MSRADRTRWDARYAALGPPTPMPPDALRGRETLLPPGGRALDLACGRGAVALWLAGRGFTVDAVDVSPEALAVARAAAPGDGSVRFLEADLDEGLPEPGPYDVIVCQRFRDPALYPSLASALAPGGLLAITVLSEVDDEPGRYRATAGELGRAFAGLEIVAEEEGGGEATLLARRPS